MSSFAPWIGPSILSSDLLRLGEQIAAVEAAGADFIHFDVMDGRFVPNITFGLPVAEAVRTATNLPLDVHLMIVEPEKFVPLFIEAGANTVTFQVEATVNAHRLLASIRELGALAGIALNPGTPASAIEELIPFADQVLVMTVNPGFGGQTFIPTQLAKIARVRAWIDERSPYCRLQVDGGVKIENIARIAAAGADTFVAGSSVFDGSADFASNIDRLRTAIE